MQSDGLRLFSGYLDRPAQEELVTCIRICLQAAPLFQPCMPRTGKPLSVKMSNAGTLGWVSDQTGGYRYQDRHPVTGVKWPVIPEPVLRIWSELAGYDAPPEACLINWYGTEKTRMGLHRDRDEAAKDAPVVSISLGASARFRVGGEKRTDPTRSFLLRSGDVLVLGGRSRHFHHGVDGIKPGTSTLLPDPQRLNLTLRRVTVP